jgi:Protein of unknown function (DUF3617)
MKVSRKAVVVSTAALGSLIFATTATSSEIRRGLWDVMIQIDYTQDSPVTKKMQKTVLDIEAMLRRLGQTPEARSPFTSKYRYRLQTCVPQDTNVGWIRTEDILRATSNWGCSVTNRDDGLKTIDLNLSCAGDSPEDLTIGEIHIEFPTDQQVKGRFEFTDPTGRTVYQSGTFMGGFSGAVTTCPEERFYNVEELP